MQDGGWRADLRGMRNLPLARALALLSILLAVAGVSLFVHSSGSLLGLILMASGIPVAAAGWVALGSPVRRRDCGTQTAA
jgi:hypothetical protein